MKSCFVNAKVVSANTPPKVYFDHLSSIKRGDPAFVMSRGELVEFDRCPRRWLAGIESDETKSTEWGSLMDGLLLSPERFNQDFAITPATYRNDKGEEKDWNWNANVCKAWREERPGQTIIKHEHYGAAKEALKRLRHDAEIGMLVEQSRHQVFVTADYYDEETKLTVPVKVLIDLVPLLSSKDFKKVLADFKTCATAAMRPWQRTVADFFYHWQAAFYLDIYTAATGEDRTDFYHVLQENYPPYETGRRLLTTDFVELGSAQYRTALARYCRCLKTQSWPGYDDEATRHWNGWQFVEPLAWMVNQ